MHKAAVLAALRQALRDEFERLRALSKHTRAAGADAESRAEGKYDTRSTEQNYLADGQAKQAQLAAQALAAFGALGTGALAADAPVALGALVELGFATGEGAWFLLGPAAGGKEVRVGDVAVTILTPEAPLGRQLLGLKRGNSTGAPAHATVRSVG